MTAPVGFLDFFILEASDYLEQLDAQLAAGSATMPDVDALQRVARALRGSATMAKIPAFAEMAAGLERVGRALRERQLEWSPALRSALVAAVDEGKTLLRNARAWTEDDSTRARARGAELSQFAPHRTPTPLAVPTAGGQDSYLATESSNIGAGLELLVTRPSDRDAAGNVLRRVRALRGIASVKDHATLADVLEAAERAAHPLELGEATLSAERIALLNAAATLLRGVSAAMRSGAAVDPDPAHLAAFATALDAMQERELGTERVLPIADLFYNDGGATVVESAPNPPTTPAERFRLEVVSQGEHLQRLVSDARGAHDELARERVRRELRLALRSLKQAAESFSEQDVADFVASHNDAVVDLNARALDSLAEVAALLAQPGSSANSLTDRLAALRTRRSASIPMPVVPELTPFGSMPAVEPRTSAPMPPVERPAAAAFASVAASVVEAASAGVSAIGDLLDKGIRNLGSLSTAPLSAPAAVAEQAPVPIEVLLYRGRAAVQRAREIRDELRGSNRAVDHESLAELYDLLDLALTD